MGFEKGSKAESLFARDSRRAARRFRQPVPEFTPVARLPQIHRTTQVVLGHDGRSVYVGENRHLAVFEIDPDARLARPRQTITLPAPLLSLTLARDGALHAWMESRSRTGEPCARVALVLGDRLAELVEVPARVHATAVTRNVLAAVVTRGPLDLPELIFLSRHDGTLIAKERVESPRARITAGSDDELLIENPGQPGQLRWLDAARRPCPPQNGDPGQPPWPRPEPRPPGATPPPCPAGCTPEPQPPTSPPRPRPRPEPGARPDHCVPGDNGVSDHCMLTYVLHGVVIRVDTCNPDHDPCTIRLDWAVRRLHLTPATIIATSQDRDRLAVLDRRTLRLLHEHRPGAGPFRVLTSSKSETALLLSDTGDAVWMDVSPVLATLEPRLADVAQPAIFHGQAAALDWQSGGIQRGTRNVLLVPVLEAGQEFNGSLADYFNLPQLRQALDTVPDYYHEASYDQPGHAGLDVRLRIFGLSTPFHRDRPIQIAKPFRDYWNDGWQPGGLEATAPLPASGVLEFSGDETLTLKTFPTLVDPRTFDIRFPVASFRVRIGASSAGHTLDFGPTSGRVMAIQGQDRDGNPVNLVASTASWPGAPLDITITKETLENGSAVQDIASALDTLLDTVPDHPFAPPEVRWQDDGNQWGMLHVALFYADSGGTQTPSVTVFDADSVFLELSPQSTASMAASFALPGDESRLATYLSRILADATVDEFGQSNIENSHFDHELRRPEVEVSGGSLRIRISLGPDHGRTVDENDPARIERVSHSGLAKIGMGSPAVIEGGTTKLSGSGAPTLEHAQELFDDVFTAMVDAAIASHGGPEVAAIDMINGYFNCVGRDDASCASELIHNVVVVPVMQNPLGSMFDGASRDADLSDPTLRAHASSAVMTDRKSKSGQRAKAVMPIGANRRKIFAKLRFGTADAPQRHLGDAATLAHELGHGILGYKDQYSTSEHRTDLVYINGYDFMGASSSDAHMTSYHKRISGWLDDDAIVVFDRPPKGVEIDREVVLVQLEAWNPTFSTGDYQALARSLMPDMADGAPVVAAVFLRLGGDGHTFDILELRGPGERFSQNIDTPRLLAINAVDPRDHTRYGEAAENAGITEDALLHYRRQLHLLDDSMRADHDRFDFGTLDKLAEPGLQVELVELASATAGSFSYSLARVHIHWVRADRAIDLGFKDSLPGWQSPDIAIIKPPDIPESGQAGFPENQPPEQIETFLVPADGEGALAHQVLARVWNFGDAEAFNVQVDLLQKLPQGAGDWRETVIGSKVLQDSLGPGESAVVAFTWEVSSEFDSHVCFRAQIGDRDPEPGALDDTSDENNWAQQNVFIHEAPADSPPRPVIFSYSVANEGPYMEEVILVPRGLGPGARMTVLPDKLRIPPRSQGVFRVRVELEERLLHARCGKDIRFLLEAWRFDDHGYEPWGATRHTIKPRLATAIDLHGSILPDQVHVVGAVTPDVGAFPILFHIDLPGQEPFWEERVLGPGSTFDFVIPGDIPPNTEVRVTARFHGSYDYASAVSKTLKLMWHLVG